MRLEQTYSDITNYGEKYHFYHNAETGIIVCTTLYKGQMVRGVAKCNPDDMFNIDLGKTLAYLRCKQKFARKKLKRAREAERDAIIAEARARHNLRKAYDFRFDSEMFLDNITAELEEFEAKFNN